MHDLPRAFLPAAAVCSAARTCQAGIAALRAAPRPLAMNERRLNVDNGPGQEGRSMMVSVFLMIRQELTAIEQGPVQIFVRLFLSSSAAALLGKRAEWSFRRKFAQGSNVKRSIG